MNPTPSRHHTRVAATMAALSTVITLGALVYCATASLQSDLTQTAGALGGAFATIACMALARLGWLCGATTIDLVRAGLAFDGAHAHALTAPQDTHPARAQSARARTAGLFLAAAAVIGPGAAAAGASTPTSASGVSVSSVANTSSESRSQTGSMLPLSTPDFGQHTDDDGGVALPGFASSTPNDSPSVTASTPSVRQQLFGPALLDARAPAASTAVPTCVPEPGWTPSLLGPDSIACHLVLAAAPTGSEHDTHVVLRGQNLWSIAAAHLPEGASPEVVAERVHDWVAANPQLAASPDVIRPGDVLRVPALATLGSAS